MTTIVAVDGDRLARDGVYTGAWVGGREYSVAVFGKARLRFGASAAWFLAGRVSGP